MAIFWIFTQIVSALALLVLLRVYVVPPKIIRRKKHRAVVVVGGDFARSPRMQYHAVSLSDCGLYSEVVCVGMHFKNQCCEDIRVRLDPKEPTALKPRTEKERKAATITLQLLPQTTTALTGNWVVRTVRRVFGFVTGFGSLLWTAMEGGISSKSDDETDCSLVLVQTPPAVPFVPLIKVVMFVMRLKRLFLSIGAKGSTKVVPKLVVDWHNFGFTLLAIDHRPTIIVWFYKFCERHFCAGDQNFTVSQAMKGVLTGTMAKEVDPTGNQHGFRLPVEEVTVLPDTAPSFFGRCSKREFLKEVVAGGKEDLKPPAWFTKKGTAKGGSEAREGLTVVSATSWTADDDYTILVDALKKIESFAAQNKKKIWAVVTGKGESRPRFEAQIKAADLDPGVITVTTVYFQSFQHYARMLGVADIGLSLHQSSSGWDLPMKVVDMFGCGLPVAATNYPALGELVTHDRHGWLFKTADELCGVLKKLLLSPSSSEYEEGESSSPGSSGSSRDDEIAVKREFVLKERGQKWNETWRATAVPVLRRLLLAEDVAVGNKAKVEPQHIQYLRDDEE